MKKFIYTDDDLLKFLLSQIKTIDVDVKESDTDEIVSTTIFYKNGSKTDYKLPRKLIDYLSDRVNGLFHKPDTRIIYDKDLFSRFEEENINELAKNNEDDCCQDACIDCKEQTYSSKEYYELKKEVIEKDHEIFLLKRKVEALEYLIYNCIPKDDRRTN